MGIALENIRVEETDAAPELLRAKINQETAKIPWKELQRFFAQGRVILVSPGLDLVEVATMAANDRAEELAAWMSNGQIGKVSDELARSWFESDAALWTVVVKPWVLVQEVGPTNGQQLH